MKTILAGLAIAALSGFCEAAGCRFDPCPPSAAAAIAGSPRIQLAILLDTSNSMDGLIGQTRSQLWRIVNELARAHRGGRSARLEVALYEYGNNGLAAETGYVRRVLPFTVDLDRVSEELFALTTNGGYEYCATVIQSALDGLAWSPSPADLKVIAIAGNEPFTQGPLSFRKVCPRAVQKGIIVNTIHCGPSSEGIEGGWAEGARIAYGSYMVIDQNKVVTHVPAPQDAEIERLGLALNDTYVPFGVDGAAGQARQKAQDSNASSFGRGSVTARAVTKANRVYSNATWDLVDAVNDGTVDLEKVRREDLPVEMQKQTPAERQAHLTRKAKDRARIQSEINRLSGERTRFVATARKGPAEADTLDAVMAKALREQASAWGLALE